MLTRAQTSRKRSQVEANIPQQQQHRPTKTTKLAPPTPCLQPITTPNKPITPSNTATTPIAATSPAFVSPSKRRRQHRRRRTELADLKANAASLRHSTTNQARLRRLVNKSTNRPFSLAVISTTSHTLLCRIAVRWHDRVWTVKERLERRLGECVVWQQLWMDRNGWKRTQDEWTMAQCFDRPQDAEVRLRIVEPMW